MPAVVQDTPLA
jgi:hypothetical protein